jgi:hypothetical protein
MGNNFDPWEFFVWLMDLTEKNAPYEEATQLIDERMNSYSYAEKVILDKFCKKYLIVEPGEGDMMEITLIDRQQHLVARRDYLRAAGRQPS